MEEKREDLLKNLKKINAIYGELDDLKAKVKEAKSSVNAITKKISAYQKLPSRGSRTCTANKFIQATDYA